MPADPAGQPDPTPAPANGPTPTPVPQPPHGDPKPDDKGKPADPSTGDDASAEARKWEKRSKDNYTALQKLQEQVAASDAATEAQKKAILKAFGLGDDEDPAEAAKRTAAERDEAAKKASQLEADLKAERRERAAERAARKAGADVDALLDSRGFVKALSDLGDDAGDDDIKKAVEAALKANPRLSATPTPPRSVTDSKGSPTEPKKRAGGLSGAVQRAMQPN